MCRAREDAALAAHSLPRIEAADLVVQEHLGEGASGVIRRSLYCTCQRPSASTFQTPELRTLN